MKLIQTNHRERRMLGAVFVIAFCISILLTAFFQTQVLTGAQYAARSEENRLRPIPIPAPRGTILDRNGEVVATSITGYSISVLPGDSSLIRATLEDLVPFLGLSQRELQQLMDKRNGRPHDLLEVKVDATFAQAAAIEERRSAFPNLLVVERPRRYYPAGAAIGHIIGYVNEINETELETEEFQEAGYRQGRLIGKQGIEKEYELDCASEGCSPLLGGTDGARFVEVDARGRVVDPRSTVGALPPAPGRSLRLSLDLELQKYIHSIFPDTLNGAVVAMVPSTGEILAMYSHPTFDPNDLFGRIPAPLWRALNNDPDKPLLDRTINALYPPASTWKLASAAEALRRGTVRPDEYLPIPCVGGMLYAGRYARCHDRRGHGPLQLAGAIEKSCNVYFYQVGIEMGLRNLIEGGVRMGFAKPTGVDLPSERKPIFPENVEWYRKRYGHMPTPSEVMTLVIGQGGNSQSVLKMAEFYSALAGDGTARRPHLVVPRDTAIPRDIDLELNSGQLEALWEGLRRVTEEGGTGLQSSLARYKLYGKTGTAQNPHGPDHGWFVGFAGVPGQQPEIVIAAIVEFGEHGDATAPLAAKAANFYLDRKHGHPFDPEPTLGERWRRGRGGTGPDGWYDMPNRRLVPIGGSANAAPAAGGALTARRTR